MTTQSWNTPLSHADDAGFRAWGSELSARLALIGLVQTADTGQVNWATVNRPATNVFGGYEVWRFDDILQGSAPVFFKLEYGTGGSATSPNLRITVGTGSNGSGTITGTATTAATLCCAQNIPSGTTTNRLSFACATDGQAWICNKYLLSGQAHAAMFFHIQRTCDSAGAPDGRGLSLKVRDSSTISVQTCGVQALKFSPAQVYAPDTTGSFCVNPHNQASSAVGADVQAFMHWNPVDGTSPDWASCSMLQSEASFGTAFPAITLVGASAPHDYLALGNAVGRTGPTTSGTAAPLGMCVVYE